MMRSIYLRTQPWGCVVVLTLVASGCTHVQLRRNSLGQAQAVHQLQQQQVLDNLAMFVANPDSVPYFTIAGAGQSSVSDQGSASTTLNWLRAGFQSIGFTVSGNRLMQENFTLAPLNDPDQLARMRCAYQTAVGYGGSPCINCCALQQQWGDKSWDGLPASTECPDGCAPQPGWYCVGCKGDVPSNACFVGCYGKTYIWVPASGTDEFARLTLQILDYATAVPGAPATKTIKTTRKFPADAAGIEKIVEETQVVLAVPPATTDASTMSDTEEFPFGAAPNVPASPAPVRQNFFVPQALPQVVIPIQ